MSKNYIFKNINRNYFQNHMMKVDRQIYIISAVFALVLFTVVILSLYSSINAADRAYTNFSGLIDDQLMEFSESDFVEGRVNSKFCSFMSMKLANNDNTISLMYDFCDFKCEDELENWLKNISGEPQYKKFFEAFLKRPSDESKEEIPHDNLKQQKVLPQQTFWVRTASKLFRNFTICKIDRVIDFVLRDTPSSERFNVIIMNYNDEKQYNVFKIQASSNNYELKLIDTLKLKLEGRDAFMIYSDILLKLALAAKSEEKQVQSE
ncbi:hypothetical protein THOM_1247 [Trachipleistophora hominis]|uniref:Transmembrane protein n=1 Tax=Trachipleistophora hominis TaxID=72359 RepID=L7JXL1_TRAHO|nr:hypothetical protein THOM_1247 [Trachipleistophora hominis]